MKKMILINVVHMIKKIRIYNTKFECIIQKYKYVYNTSIIHKITNYAINHKQYISHLSWIHTNAIFSKGEK